MVDSGAPLEQGMDLTEPACVVNPDEENQSLKGLPRPRRRKAIRHGSMADNDNAN